MRRHTIIILYACKYIDLRTLNMTTMYQSDSSWQLLYAHCLSIITPHFASDTLPFSIYVQCIYHYIMKYLAPPTMVVLETDSCTMMAMIEYYYSSNLWSRQD